MHTHNSTFSHSARHTKRVGVHRVWVHPDDARERGLAEDDLARIANRRGAVTLPVGVSEDLPRGLVRVDGLPRAEDVPEGVGINVLVGPAVSDLGDSNTLYSTRVDARPV